MTPLPRIGKRSIYRPAMPTLSTDSASSKCSAATPKRRSRISIPRCASLRNSTKRVSIARSPCRSPATAGRHRRSCRNSFTICRPGMPTTRLVPPRRHSSDRCHIHVDLDIVPDNFRSKKEVPMKRHLLLVLMLLLIPAALLAQTGSAALGGRVSDETGAPLPGVTVTATNNATGFSRSVVTGSDGSYRFASLPVGMYNVTADLQGFTSVTTRNVELNVAQERELNVSLKQAAVKEQITVTASSPLVETTPATSTVISQKEMENLPLNGRQFANLGSLAPGTTLSVNADPTKPGQLTIALNGGSGRNVDFLVDGGDNTDDTIGGALQNFNIEAV